MIKIINQLTEAFYIRKIINLYNYNFIKNKEFPYICALKLHVCKVLIGAAQVKRNFKTKLTSVNSGTPYIYM